MKKRCLDCKWFGVVYNEDEIEPCDITVCMGEEPEWRTLKVTDQYGKEAKRYPVVFEGDSCPDWIEDYPSCEEPDTLDVIITDLL
jgi:hypothetical protein